MSDCSTQAMEPREPLKTCGTCHYSTPRKYGHWTTNNLICLLHAVSTHSERHHVTACGWGIAGPRGWRPKEPDALEQRYQQLEQLAKEMYRSLTFCAGGCGEGCPMLDDGCAVDSGMLRSQLEALGVSLDD